MLGITLFSISILVALGFTIYLPSICIPCQEPSTYPQIISNLSHESNLISQRRALQNGIGTIPSEFLNVSILEIHQHKRNTRRISNWQKVVQGSTCPWKFVINFDPNRKPSALTEAQCTRQCCNGDEECRTTRCEELKYELPVLRRVGCRHGVFVYQQVYETLAAGCTCVYAVDDAFAMPIN